LGSQSDQFVRFHETGQTVAVALPERITVNYEIADLGTRFYAVLFDGLLQGLASGIFTVALLALSALTAGRMPTIGGDAVLATIVVVNYIVEVGYFSLFEGLGGRTPGKSLMGLRVVRADGQTLGLGSVLIRNVVRVFDNMYVGVLAMLLSPRAQRLGDIAGRTIVVRGSAVSRLADLTSGAAVMMAPRPSDREIELSALSDVEIMRIQSVVARRAELTDAFDVVSALAEIARTKLGLRERALDPLGGSDWRLLEQIDAAARVRPESPPGLLSNQRG
jgi:uncharacterized RDD family membrane protein YckC